MFKNCIEAMPSGGELSILTMDTSSNIIISISDKGVGMNEEQLKRLGEPYYSTKENHL
ncbi:ATP-binding protein [Peribacillus cavernae]|nr:ATP-binding protein [Peribacillus cavernae]